MTKVIIGLGTGRCGTRSLAILLNEVEGLRVTHEAFRFNNFWNSNGLVTAKWYHNMKDTLDEFGDVHSAYLPEVEFIDEMIKKNGDKVYFVCLERDFEKVVESFYAWTEGKEKQNRIVNHWQMHDGTRWKHDHWDGTFPKFDPRLSKKDAIKEYVALYRGKSSYYDEEMDNFKIFKTDDLNSTEGLDKIYDFIGITENRRVYKSVHANSLLTPPKKR